MSWGQYCGMNKHEIFKCLTIIHQKMWLGNSEPLSPCRVFFFLHRYTETWHTLNSRRGDQVTPQRQPQQQRNAFWKISASSWRTETRPSRESQIWASNRVITDYEFSYFLFADFNSVDLHQTGGFHFSLLLRKNIQFDFDSILRW